MALKFISQNSTPTYIALSSDIVDSTIDGCIIIGGTVFLTDTYEWYIVKEDLTLESYSLPISLAGDITIGLVNQGSAGLEAWPITLSSEFARLQVSQGVYSQVISDESHFHAHNGTLWSASYINTNISASGTVVIGMETGANPIHLKVEHESVGGGKVEFYSGCTFTGGTPILIINHDLSISASAGNPDVSIVLTPTVSVEGSIFRSLLVPGSGSGANKTGGASPFSEEFIVPASTQFYMKYTNLDGNAGMYGTTVRFYEA